MSIELEHLTKRYQGTPVVDNVSLAVATGELFVLLGPSGSGKSTLLRMIAGLAEVEEGSVRLFGRDVTAVSPREREIGFVFQHYGLFQNMSVADNVEFALRVRKVPERKRHERREELLQLVGLSGFSQRFPRQLSGGQQQRVALARALAHEPRVLLLDEPFGALDARIRSELRQSLRQVQRELGLTMVFVTHDQEEAFELADRMAVLRDGRLLEVGVPQELYLRPRSPFVATFLGAANLLVGKSTERSVSLGSVELALGSEAAAGGVPRRTQVLFRPEDMEITPIEHGEHPRLGHGTVEQRVVIGGFERLRLRLPKLPTVRAVSPAPPFGADYMLVEAVRPQHEAASFPLAVGASAWVAVRRFHVLASASLRLLVDSGAEPQEQAAAALGEQIAARIDGHMTLLTDGRDGAVVTPAVPEEPVLGAETESGGHGFAIAVLGLRPNRMRPRMEWLSRLRHHLLLVAGPCAVPTRFLVCVEVSERGKEDVHFAERFAWQLGAVATVLTVLPDEPEGATANGHTPAYVDRFLEACTRALSARGVVAHARVRRGPVLREILTELEEGAHDLVVVGAPLRQRPDRPERHPGSASVVERLIHDPPRCPLLVVRR